MSLYRIGLLNQSAGCDANADLLQKSKEYLKVCCTNFTNCTDKAPSSTFAESSRNPAKISESLLSVQIPYTPQVNPVNPLESGHRKGAGEPDHNKDNNSNNLVSDQNANQDLASFLCLLFSLKCAPLWELCSDENDVVEGPALDHSERSTPTCFNVQPVIKERETLISLNGKTRTVEEPAPENSERPTPSHCNVRLVRKELETLVPLNDKTGMSFPVKVVDGVKALSAEVHKSGEVLTANPSVEVLNVGLHYPLKVVTKVHFRLSMKHIRRTIELYAGPMPRVSKVLFRLRTPPASKRIVYPSLFASNQNNRRKLPMTQEEVAKESKKNEVSRFAVPAFYTRAETAAERVQSLSKNNGN